MDWLHYNYYSRKVSNRSKISFQNYTLPSSRSSFPPPPPPPARSSKSASNRFVRVFVRSNLWRGSWSRIKESFKRRVIQEGRPEAHVVFSISSSSRYSSTVSGAVMADKHGQVPTCTLRVGCYESSHARSSTVSSPSSFPSLLFPSFFSSPLHPPPRFFFVFVLLERVGRSLVSSACRFRRLRYPIPI